MVHDDRAEQLEAQGLWRRAAARWLEVMKQASSDLQREHIARRREICLENAKLPPQKRDTFSDVSSAANKLIGDMGLKVEKESYYSWMKKK